MSPKTLLLAAPAALAALLLAWAVRGSREEPAPPRAKPPRKAAAAAAAKAAEEPLPVAAGPASPPDAPVFEGAAETAIRGRVAELERRLAELESRRDTLEAENTLLETQISERRAQATAQATAQWRVRSWEKLLGLSDTQKQGLLDLAAAWAMEDAGRKASRDTWAARESELRARLSSEQAAKLTQSTVSTAATQWGFMGRTIAQYVGLPASEHARLQQTLGVFPAPSNALLPEAHGLEWAPLFKEAAARTRPLLTTEQADRLDKHVARF